MYYVETDKGDNKDLRLYSDFDDATIAVVVSGNYTPLSVSVASHDVTIYSATNGSGVAISTAIEVMDLINQDTFANAVLYAVLHSGMDGSGVFGSLTQTSMVYTHIPEHESWYVMDAPIFYEDRFWYAIGGMVSGKKSKYARPVGSTRNRFYASIITPPDVSTNDKFYQDS